MLWGSFRLADSEPAMAQSSSSSSSSSTLITVRWGRECSRLHCLIHLENIFSYPGCHIACWRKMLAVSASLQCLSSEEEQSGSIASGLVVGDGWLSQSCFNGFPDRGRKEAFAKRGRTKNVQRIWNKYLFMRIFYICVLFMLYLYIYIYIYTVYLYMFIT